jgi:hypothetical protein
MILSENHFTPQIKCEAGFFGIMRFALRTILPDLPTPRRSIRPHDEDDAFAQAGNRFTPRIKCGASFFAFMCRPASGSSFVAADRPAPDGAIARAFGAFRHILRFPPHASKRHDYPGTGES